MVCGKFSEAESEKSFRRCSIEFHPQTTKVYYGLIDTRRSTCCGGPVVESSESNASNMTNSSLWWNFSLSVWFRAIQASIVSAETRTRANVHPKEPSICNAISFGALSNSRSNSSFYTFCAKVSLCIRSFYHIKAPVPRCRWVIGEECRWTKTGPRWTRYFPPSRNGLWAILNENFSDWAFCFVLCHQISSTPLSAAKRLQFALDMEPVEKFDLMSKLPRTIVPLMWVEESAHLNTTYTKLFKGLYTWVVGKKLFC